MAKIITLNQLRMLAERVKSEDDDLAAQIQAIADDLNGIISTGGEANMLEGIKVNGQALAITDKMVDILIATGEENGTLSVNGAAVAIKGLQAMAYRAEISYTDLSEALKASIASKATSADLSSLTVRVTTAEGNITEIQGDIESLQNAGYQTSEQVQAAIQTAVSNSKHAHFEKVDAVPTADAAEENVMYLVMNADTGHYDIYALVSGSVELLDDTTVDLSKYSTTEQMNAAISEAVAALSIGDYAKAADLTAALARIASLESLLANYYSKTDVDAMLDAYATDAEAETIADEKIAAATATDADVTAMLDEILGTS